MVLREDWKHLGLCREGDKPDAMYEDEPSQAKKICNGCPVKIECLAEALDRPEEFGVWGGYTVRERRALLGRYPHIESWHRVFNEALFAESAGTVAVDAMVNPQSPHSRRTDGTIG